MADAVVGIVVAVAVILITIYILRQTIYVVQQAEGIAIERLGRFERVLHPGWHCVWCCLEAPRNFSWRKT